jgi:hypothetical protein
MIIYSVYVMNDWIVKLGDEFKICNLIKDKTC